MCGAIGGLGLDGWVYLGGVRYRAPYRVMGKPRLSLTGSSFNTKFVAANAYMRQVAER